jgi:hypothetical protein
MRATNNDITGDAIRSKHPSKKYMDNYDLIFRKKEVTANTLATIINN